jgi:hypothetical protein
MYLIGRQSPLLSPVIDTMLQVELNYRVDQARPYVHGINKHYAPIYSSRTWFRCTHISNSWQTHVPCGIHCSLTEYVSGCGGAFKAFHLVHSTVHIKHTHTHTHSVRCIKKSSREKVEPQTLAIHQKYSAMKIKFGHEKVQPWKTISASAVQMPFPTFSRTSDFLVPGTSSC